MPKDDIWDQSAVVHDFLYRHKGILPDGSYGTKKTYTREESDKVFYIGNKILGEPKIKNELAYAALRAAGWIAWNFGKDEMNKL
jgi:hypothetical protein